MSHKFQTKAHVNSELWSTRSAVSNKYFKNRKSQVKVKGSTFCCTSMWSWQLNVLWTESCWKFRIGTQVLTGKCTITHFTILRWKVMVIRPLSPVM